MISSNQANTLNVELLFKCTYTSAIPTLISYLLLKMTDQNQIINEFLAFLIAVLDCRPGEFSRFLNQCLTQKFSIFDDKMKKELNDALLAKDKDKLRNQFKELKQMYQQVKPNYSHIQV